MIAQVLIGQERFVGKIGLPGSRLLGAVKQGHIELMSPYLLVPGNQVIQVPFVERRFPAGTPPLRIGASSGNRFGRPEIIVFYKIVPGLKGRLVVDAEGNARIGECGSKQGIYLKPSD